ncbi:MAG: amino acid ABC transporter ATP-binding protein [Actinomycetales bacterium]
MNPLLSVNGVWKSFEGNPVLRGLDLQVNLHQAVVLIGASGSGKSTLLRCINGLDVVDAGRIWLGGPEGGLEISALDANLDAIRRRIGIVFQSYNLFPHLSVLQNITLAPRKVLGRGKRDANDVGMSLLDRFGLADKAGQFPDRLSGGQAQRVAIVRALAMEPELLLFDEITSALDPQLVGEVLATVQELKRDGLTFVMATHEMQFASAVADLVCFLHEGRVLESGPPEQIFSDPQESATRTFLARVRLTG